MSEKNKKYNRFEEVVIKAPHGTCWSREASLRVEKGTCLIREVDRLRRNHDAMARVRKVAGIFAKIVATLGAIVSACLVALKAAWKFEYISFQLFNEWAGAGLLFVTSTVVIGFLAWLYHRSRLMAFSVDTPSGEIYGNCDNILADRHYSELVVAIRRIDALNAQLPDITRLLKVAKRIIETKEQQRIFDERYQVWKTEHEECSRLADRVYRMLEFALPGTIAEKYKLDELVPGFLPEKQHPLDVIDTSKLGDLTLCPQEVLCEIKDSKLLPSEERVAADSEVDDVSLPDYKAKTTS